MTKTAAALTTGDRVVDPATGATAVVIDRHGIRSKHRANHVGFLARKDDGRIVRFTVEDTARVEVI